MGGALVASREQGAGPGSPIVLVAHGGLGWLRAAEAELACSHLFAFINPLCQFTKEGLSGTALRPPERYSPPPRPCELNRSDTLRGASPLQFIPVWVYSEVNPRGSKRRCIGLYGLAQWLNAMIFQIPAGSQVSDPAFETPAFVVRLWQSMCLPQLGEMDPLTTTGCLKQPSCVRARESCESRFHNLCLSVGRH